MISIVELVACCGSSTSSSSSSSSGQQPAPRRRVGLRAIRCRRRRWKPTLMSISEDVFAAEKAKADAAERPMLRWRRRIFNKIMSVSSSRNRSLSFDRGDDYCRRRSVSLSTTIMPAFAPPPLMF